MNALWSLSIHGCGLNFRVKPTQQSKAKVASFLSYYVILQTLKRDPVSRLMKKGIQSLKVLRREAHLRFFPQTAKLHVCLSVLCLQIVDCHIFTHFCAVSVKILKSSREQGVLSSGHCSRCSIVCGCVPPLHEGSPVLYLHLIKFALVRPTPGLRPLSVFHVGLGALLFGGRFSDG